MISGQSQDKIPVAIDELPNRRSPRFQMTIGHLTAAVLVFALAIGPVVLALRSPDPNTMVAAVAFDLIMLPVIVALIVMIFMPPGQRRNWVIAGLCATPILVWIAVSITSAPFFLLEEAFRNRSWLRLLQACFFFVILYNGFVSWRNRLCPRCGGRQFEVECKIDPTKRASLPTGLRACKQCGQRIRLVQGWFGRFHVEPVDDASTPAHAESEARTRAD